MTRSQRVKFGSHLSCFDEEDEQLTGSPVFKREFLGAVFAALTSNQGKGFLPRRTLILLDNAHRLDAPSWELLEDLTAKPPARRGRARVVVVLAKRGGAELPAAWERLASFEDRILHLTLQPLDAFASSRLLCAALDVPLHAVTPATVENVRRKCAGLPVLVLALCDDLCGNQISGADNLLVDFHTGADVKEHRLLDPGVLRDPALGVAERHDGEAEARHALEEGALRVRGRTHVRKHHNRIRAPEQLTVRRHRGAVHAEVDGHREVVHFGLRA